MSGPSTPLQLYRHLLRASSYLPPYARPYIDGRIKARFRNHSHSTNLQTPLRQGHHALRYLRAAVGGDLARMRRVLLMVFGRVGYRRRLLLDHLLIREAPAGTESLEQYMKEAAAKLKEERKPDWLDQWNLERLTAFAASQARRNFNNSPVPELQQKQLSMKQYTTGTNIWGNPIGPKLARSRLRKAWKTIARRILPPISKSEWELLRDLSLGNADASVWKPPPRRSPGPNLVDGDSEADAWNWEAYASRPIYQVERMKGRRFKLLSGEVDHDSATELPPIGRHNYTAKSWRRLLESIWLLTATMEKSSTGEGWDVTWGGEAFRPPAATSAHAEFFQGLPDTPQSVARAKRG